MRTTLPLLLATILVTGACELGDEPVTDDEAGDEADDLPGTIALPGAVGYIHFYQFGSGDPEGKYSGMHEQRVDHDTDFGNQGDDFDNRTSSIINKTGDYWLLFSGYSYYGDYMGCIKPRSHIAQLPEGVNNRLSSTHRTGLGYCPNNNNVYGTPN